jgi:hypothetical protein
MVEDVKKDLLLLMLFGPWVNEEDDHSCDPLNLSVLSRVPD